MIAISTSIAVKRPSNVRNKRVAVKAGKLLSSTCSVSGQAELLDVTLNTNPFLSLQEVSDYENAQINLKEYGDRLLGCLNDIRLGMLSGRINEQHLTYLKQTIDESNIQLNFPELQQLMENILLRAAVELEKLRMNHK